MCEHRHVLCMYVSMCACECVRVSICKCVCMCVHACVCTGMCGACMYQCMHVSMCMFMCVCEYMQVCVHVFVCVCMCFCACEYRHVLCMYISICACECVHVWAYASAYAYVCVCVHEYVCTCACVHFSPAELLSSPRRNFETKIKMQIHFCSCVRNLNKMCSTFREESERPESSEWRAEAAFSQPLAHCCLSNSPKLLLGAFTGLVTPL